MIVPERLKTAMELRGMSQSALARAANISASMVNKLATGNARETAHIYALAKALDCSPEYLSGETDDASRREIVSGIANATADYVSFEDMAAERGLLPIRHIDLAFGMGATYLDNPVEEEMRFFPEAFIRAFTKAPPSMIYFAEGAGDSMMSTIHSNDVVIIDTSANRITMADQIWACIYAGLGMIKRLRPMPDGGVKILSDNPSVPDDVAYDGELNLVGRVVGVARKI